MSEKVIFPISFIGIADHIKSAEQPFPIGPIDIFQFSQHKSHIIYPAMIKDNQWVFLMLSGLVDTDLLNKLKIRIIDEKERKLASIDMSTVPEEGAKNVTTQDIHEKSELLIGIGVGFSSLLYIKIDTVVNRPGRYIIQAKSNGEFIKIGEVYFHYQPTPPLTADQIKAIEADPNSAKTVSLQYRCKLCTSKIKIYTALERQPKIESEGFIWQYDVKDELKCECEKTHFSSKYIRESLQGLLLKGSSLTLGLKYERMYGHSQVIAIIKEYDRLLETEKDEKPFQQFIEKNPLLLSIFHAKRLFIKRKILGKFETDFVILNSRNELLLIELEKPSLKLFKSDGHPTSELMHAYGQVTDWLLEYTKHPTAVIEGLKIKNETIMAVKGIVIAGKSSSDIMEPLQRHLSAPPYPDIAFNTFDDLSRSLLEISRKLA